MTISDLIERIDNRLIEIAYSEGRIESNRRKIAAVMKQWHITEAELAE